MLPSTVRPAREAVYQFSNTLTGRSSDGGQCSRLALYRQETWGLHGGVGWGILCILVWCRVAQIDVEINIVIVTIISLSFGEFAMRVANWIWLQLEISRS